MRPIHDIATDVFNGIIVNGEEQLAFVAKYGDGSAAYGIPVPAPEPEEPLGFQTILLTEEQAPAPIDGTAHQVVDTPKPTKKERKK